MSESSYRIEIEAQGQHHLGHTTGNLDKDADNLLKKFLQDLETKGHKIKIAAFHHGENTDILVGSPEQIMTGARATENPDPTLHEKLDQVKGLLERLVEDAAKPAPKPRAKKGAPEPDTGNNPSPAPADAPAELPTQGTQDAQGNEPLSTAPEEQTETATE